MFNDNPIPGNERAVIVGGMARSGTTVFTSVLCRHPRIALCRDGAEAWLLENDILPRRGVPAIARAIAKFPSSAYVAFKRPWIEQQALWLAVAFPEARFVVLKRERESIFRSWRTSQVMGCHPEARRFPDLLYTEYERHAEQLAELVGPERFRTVQYERMLADPRGVFEDIAAWLEVPDWFDVEPIVSGRNWNAARAAEFPH